MNTELTHATVSGEQLGRGEDGRRENKHKCSCFVVAASVAAARTLLCAVPTGHQASCRSREAWGPGPDGGASRCPRVGRDSPPSPWADPRCLRVGTCLGWMLGPRPSCPLHSALRTLVSEAQGTWRAGRRMPPVGCAHQVTKENKDMRTRRPGQQTMPEVHGAVHCLPSACGHLEERVSPTLSQVLGSQAWPPAQPFH